MSTRSPTPPAAAEPGVHKPALLARPVTVADVESAFVRDRPLIARICLGYLHNADDADDAAQETYARVVAHTDAITGDLSAYVKMTARNVCRDLRRRRAVEQRSPASTNVDCLHDPQSVAVEQQHLATVLPQMSASDLRLIALHFAGFSYEEIARRLGTSLTCVSVGLTRARKRARQLAESPARLGGWIGLLWPWRQAARLRSVQSKPEGARLAQYATVLTAIAVLTVPFAPGANPGIAGHPRSAAGGGRGPMPAATPTGPVASLAGFGVQTRDLIHRAIDAGTGTPRPEAALGTRQESGPALAPSPRTTAFTSVVASPGYAQDHTAYATGYSPACACGAYFVTHDAARTWHLLPAITLGGAHLLGVAEPGDRLLTFVKGFWLEVSTPGGTAFGPTIPAARAAATPDGRDVMLVTPTRPSLVRYDVDTTLLSPGPRLPPKFQVDDIAYAGPAGTLLVAGFWADGGSSPHEVILACSALVCTTRADLPLAPAGAILVRSSSPGAASEVVVLWDDGQAVLVSNDAGYTWRSLFPAGAPAAAVMVAVVTGRDGTPGVVVGRSTAPTFPALRFSGAELTASRFDTALFGPWPLYLMAQLPDGRMLANFANFANLAGAPPPGLLCSIDDGASWQPTCP